MLQNFTQYNIDYLERNAGVLSGTLIDTYRTATTLTNVATQITVESLDGWGESCLGYYDHSGVDNGVSSVWMHMKDTGCYEKYVNNEESVNRLSEFVDLKGSEDTRIAILASFTLGHEIGHAHHWQRKSDVQIGLLRSWEERQYPYPWKTAEELQQLMPRFKRPQYWAMLSRILRLEQKGIATPDDLIKAQKDAYAQMPSERSASHFASAVLKSKGAHQGHTSNWSSIS